jgi:hypothetical protein
MTTRSPEVTPFCTATPLPMTLAEFDGPQARNVDVPLSAHDHQGVLVRILCRTNDCTQRNCQRRLAKIGRRSTQGNGANHPGSKTPILVRDRDLDVEHPALWIRRRRERGDAAHERCRRDCIDEHLDALAQLHRGNRRVRNSEPCLDGADVSQHEADSADADERADLDLSFEQHSTGRSDERAVAQRAECQLDLCLRGRDTRLRGVERGLCGIELGLRQAVCGEECVGAFQIQPRLPKRRLSLRQLCAPLVDAFPVVGFMNAREDGTSIHVISGLHDASPPIRALASNELVHVTRGLERQRHFLKGLDGRRVADTRRGSGCFDGLHPNGSRWLGFDALDLGARTGQRRRRDHGDNEGGVRHGITSSPTACSKSALAVQNASNAC